MIAPAAEASALAALRTEMRDFIDHSVIPREDVLIRWDDDATRVTGELQNEAKARGLWALGHPSEIGGGGMGLADFAYLNEIIGRTYWGQIAVGSVSMQDSIMLMKLGTQEQRARWLVPLVRGEIRSSVGMSEPEVAGSDPTLMQTSARLDGDSWLINGRKWFTTGASLAAFTTVFARTETDDVPVGERFTAFIVPTDSPGYTLRRIIPTICEIHAPDAEITLEDVRMPPSSILGQRGGGLRVAQSRLGPGRLFHCMRWIGQAQRAFELMVERANTRYAHGSLLSEKGEIRRFIAKSATEIHATRLMTIDAARRLDAGHDARVQLSMIKVAGAEMLHNVIDRAIQVHGALGVSGDTPLEGMYRAARYARIYDGPDEVHDMVVGRRLLRHPDLLWGEWAH
jgi:alkylation response protein AidB-like acyl-CoA dehydrogenase